MVREKGERKKEKVKRSGLISFFVFSLNKGRGLGWFHFWFHLVAPKIILIRAFSLVGDSGIRSAQIQPMIGLLIEI